MWSEVSQIRQPHDGVLEANKQSEFEQQREIYLRAQKLGLVAKEILEITGYYVDGTAIKGAPYTMIGEPVSVGRVSDSGDEEELHDYVRAYVAFDKTQHKEIERSRFLRRANYSYVPDFEKVAKVGVLYLTGLANPSELTHVGSAHWSRAESARPEEVIAIENSLKTLQNTMSGLTVVRNEIAS
jgi:hypothetical protein